MTPSDVLSRGISRENRTAVLLVGLCPAAAVSVRVIDSLWMSAGIFVVMLLSSFCTTLLARGRADDGEVTPRAAAGSWLAALVISSFLTGSFELVLLRAAPEASAALGIYAPLIAVNCLVLTVIDESSRALSPARAVLDAAGKGAVFAACLLLISVLREVLGAGTITLFPVSGFSGTIVIGSLSSDPARAFSFAGGGLLCLGYLAALVGAVKDRRP
ncbi:MAG: Rnf-Nqr domain containing protein [Spirochaetia bacterium]|nr:Rnf-Nqr domain containing protein [Spirochaetia bacterium]